MAWWGWLLLAFVFFKVLRRRAYGMGCGMHRQRMRTYGWGWGPGVVVIDTGERGSRCGSRGTRERQREREAAPEPPVSLSPSEQRERAISELRRRYVADDITVEEYERKLDELLREQPN
jgi:hypothetical protein